jgi:choline dehydrogenase-like flavoprotein
MNIFQGAKHVPKDFDVIVIGSGAGGGTFAYACARAGKRVLLLERGERYRLEKPLHDERAMLIDKKPYDERPVWLNGSPRHFYMGSVLGGSTALYGAVLLRPSPEDFHPGKHYGPRLPQACWDWPITYEELKPYYTQAELLYRVSHAGDTHFDPLPAPQSLDRHSDIPLKPINQALVAANRARGLRPFRLPLAIDFTRCLQCAACPGYICLNGARHGAEDLIQRVSVDGPTLQIGTSIEVDCLTQNGRGQIDGVRALDRGTGKSITYRAQRYALAAGAISSPVLLLRSGLGGPLVGRYYMRHLCPITIGIFRRRTGADETCVKQVGFADFYFGSKEYRHKLGLIQSLPVPGPLMMAKAGMRGLPKPAVEILRRYMLPLTGIVEDLPRPMNRVTLGHQGKMILHHSFDPYDLGRGRQQGRLMGRILKNAGALGSLCRSFPSDDHVAHQCGTLRFGNDPAQAVLDPDCRMFGQPNLFVVDGSFLPTSLGVGPALTIMANALRVADVVTREL